MLALSIVLIIVLIVLFDYGIFMLLQRKKESGPTLAPRVGGGWVLHRRLAGEHECHPPGVSAHYYNIQGGGTYWNMWAGKAGWSDGDLWLCECGKAWSVKGASDFIPKWVRTPAEDMA